MRRFLAGGQAISRHFTGARGSFTRFSVAALEPGCDPPTEPANKHDLLLVKCPRRNMNPYCGAILDRQALQRARCTTEEAFGGRKWDRKAALR